MANSHKQTNQRVTAAEYFIVFFQVNVTFPSSGECNKQTSSYIALNNITLPCTFDGMTGDVHSNTNSSLQMDFSESGTVVTLRAHWINSVVIIRRIGEFLSVTMQVPGMMAFQSKGLCTATCPSHHYVGKLTCALACL